MNKKTTAILLTALLILFGIMIPAEGFSDTDNTNYGQDADLLAALGIMTGGADGTFGADKEVTRAEYADIMVKALGADENMMGGADTQVFTDVSPDYWAAKSIYILYKMNIMAGLADASFQPDAKITYGEAVKAMTCALGYGKTAELQGGYPAGYLSLAAWKGISKGISANMDTIMTRKMTAKLVSNGIQTDIMTMSSIGDTVDMEVQKGKTLLSEYLHVIRAEGMVTERGKISMVSEQTSLSEDRVSIGGLALETGKVNALPFLGMNTVFYYYDDSDGGDSVLIYIRPDKDGQNVVDVKSDDIMPQTTGSCFVYIKPDSKKKETLSIPENARVIYNNKLLSIVTDDVFQPETGSVRLIDSNDDKQYETVIIKDYKTYVADSTVPLDGIVNTKYGAGSLTLDQEDDTNHIRFYKDGEETDISSVGEWSVLSILESKNVTGSKMIEVYISSYNVEGEVKELNVSSGDEAITLSDGKSYPIANDYVKRVAAGAEDSDYPKVGKEYTLYLDIFGSVAAYDSGSNFSLKYGYMINAAAEGSISQNVQFKIFSSAGEMEIYGSDSKITFNGTSMSPLGVLSCLQNNGEVTAQLVAYDLTSEDKVTMLKTAVDKTADISYVTGKDEFNLMMNKTTGGTRFYKWMVSGGRYAIGASTIVFEVPVDLTREKDFKVGRKFSNDESVPAPLKFYNVGNGGMIGAMVMSTSSSQDMSQPYIVDKVTQAVDEDGNQCYKISFSNGSPVYGTEGDVGYDTTLNWGYNNIRMKDLKTGDIVEYVLVNNMVNKLRVVLRANDLGSLRIDADSVAGNEIVEDGHQLARICTLSDDKKFMVIEYTMNSALTRETRRVEGSIKRYNSSTKKVAASSAGDLREGDLVYVNTKWLSSRLIVIYR